MKFISAILLLVGCQQLLAAKIPSPMEMARQKLGELKFNLEKDIAGLPEMPALKRATPKSAPTGQVPDFEARKIELDALRSKLASLQSSQEANPQPNSAFHAEMQKVLKEAMNVKMMDFKAPKFSAKKAAQLKAKATTTVQLEEPRYVTNFTEEINRLHELGTTAHRRYLDETRVERVEMVRIIGDVYQEMILNVGNTTEHMWRNHAAVQAAIDYDVSVGASAECVAEQVDRFAAANRYYGSDISRCAYYVNTRGLMYIRTVYYPVLQRMQTAAGGLQYVILFTTSFINLARDQQALINFIDNEFVSVESLWTQNFLVLLRWEEQRYDDTMLVYRDELNECLNYLSGRYAEEATDIIRSLNTCAVPTDPEAKLAL